MRTNDFYQTNTSHPNYFIKMTKTRTVTVLLMIISTCGVILSLTDAYPTADTTNAENLNETNLDLKNNTQIVITHLVKSIEFEIGIIEDDGVDGADSDNGTSLTSQYIETETDIKLLDVDLLREILHKMDRGNSSYTAEKQEKEGFVPSQSTEEKIFEN